MNPQQITENLAQKAGASPKKPAAQLTPMPKTEKDLTPLAKKNWPAGVYGEYYEDAIKFDLDAIKDPNIPLEKTYSGFRIEVTYGKNPHSGNDTTTFTVMNAVPSSNGKFYKKTFKSFIGSIKYMHGAPCGNYAGKGMSAQEQLELAAEAAEEEKAKKEGRQYVPKTKPGADGKGGKRVLGSKVLTQSKYGFAYDGFPWCDAVAVDIKINGVDENGNPVERTVKKDKNYLDQCNWMKRFHEWIAYYFMRNPEINNSMKLTVKSAVEAMQKAAKAKLDEMKAELQLHESGKKRKKEGMPIDLVQANIKTYQMELDEFTPARILELQAEKWMEMAKKDRDGFINMQKKKQWDENLKKTIELPEFKEGSDYLSFSTSMFWKKKEGDGEETVDKAALDNDYVRKAMASGFRYNDVKEFEWLRDWSTTPPQDVISSADFQRKCSGFLRDGDLAQAFFHIRIGVEQNEVVPHLDIKHPFRFFRPDRVPTVFGENSGATMQHQADVDDFMGTAPPPPPPAAPTQEDIALQQAKLAWEKQREEEEFKRKQEADLERQLMDVSVPASSSSSSSSSTPVKTFANTVVVPMPVLDQDEPESEVVKQFNKKIKAGTA